MRKAFTFLLPDEPYKTTTVDNNTVNAVYTGPRYLALCVIDATGEIKYIAKRAETEAELNFEALVDDDPATTFIKLDADVHTFQAAYLTNAYEYAEEIPDYEEDVPGGKYTYQYDQKQGALGQCRWVNDMKYVDGNYVGPRFREHANSRASFFESIKLVIPAIENAISQRVENLYTDEDVQKLEDHLDFLKNIETTYAGVDHWKIPFPSDLPNYY